jgi:hypothetical protein
VTKGTGAKCERLDSNCVDANRKQVDEKTWYVRRQKVGKLFEGRQTKKLTEAQTELKKGI